MVHFLSGRASVRALPSVSGYARAGGGCGKAVRAAALYDTGVGIAWGDQLLTLSTCEYSVKNGRFVVARRIDEN